MEGEVVLEGTALPDRDDSQLSMCWKACWVEGSLPLTQATIVMGGRSSDTTWLRRVLAAGKWCSGGKPCFLRGVIFNWFALPRGVGCKNHVQLHNRVNNAARIL